MRDDLRKRIERLDPGKPEATPSPVYLAEFEWNLSIVDCRVSRLIGWMAC